MAVDEVHVDEPLASDHVQKREGQGGVAAGKRLQMEIGRLGGRGPDGVDHDHPGGRLGQPVVMRVRRRSGRIRAPDENAGGIAGSQRVEADERGAVHVLERDVPGLVADRVRVDLGRAESVEEAQRKEVGEEREGARVVGVQDCVRAGGRLDATETLGDVPERIVPGDGLKLPLALRAGPAQRARQPRRRIEKGAVVADRALAAELAAAHRMLRIAADVPDRPVALDDRDAARVVAVPGTRRQHHLVNLGYHDRLTSLRPRPGSRSSRLVTRADRQAEPLRQHLHR